MQAKATIEQVNRYRITIGENTYDDFEKCGEWEGMVKFSGPAGTLIVNDPDTFENTFSTLYGSKEQKKPVTMAILKASPDLVPTTTPAAATAKGGEAK